MAYLYALELGGKDLFQLDRFFKPIQRHYNCTVIGTMVHHNAISIQFQSESKLDQDELIRRAYRNGINLGITEVAPVA